jgi:hypothetical protein
MCPRSPTDPAIKSPAQIQAFLHDRKEDPYLAVSDATNWHREMSNKKQKCQGVNEKIIGETVGSFGGRHDLGYM